MLRANGTLSTNLPMTLTGTGGDATVDCGTYAVTFSGVLSGTGGLNKLGTGSLTLSASNTFTGDTTIGSGGLILGKHIRVAKKYAGLQYRSAEP